MLSSCSSFLTSISSYSSFVLSRQTASMILIVLEEASERKREETRNDSSQHESPSFENLTDKKNTKHLVPSSCLFFIAGARQRKKRRPSSSKRVESGSAASPSFLFSRFPQHELSFKHSPNRFYNLVVQLLSSRKASSTLPISPSHNQRNGRRRARRFRCNFEIASLCFILLPTS